jgi:hypothetical protein
LRSAFVPVVPSALFVAVLLGAPASADDAPDRVEEVASRFAGTFDSSGRGEADPKACRAERLVAVRVPGSRLGDGAPVLYVERALTTKVDRPHRQRFYRIEETADGGVVARVFEPKEALAVSGKWRDPSDLALFGTGDVIERIGCALRLKRTDDGWAGGSEGTNCPSALAGARYARSDLKLAPGRMELLERGFDSVGRQVWGPATPCVFERRSTAAPSETEK